MAGKDRLARSVRTGLDRKMAPPLTLCEKTDPLGELYYGRRVGAHVRDFACLLALILIVVAGYRTYIHGLLLSSLIFCIVAAVLLLLGYRFPRLLHPFWKGWMAAAEKIGLVMTFLVVSIAWVIVLLPTAVLLKMIKKTVMDLTLNPAAVSYWEDREANQHDFTMLEKQF